MKKFLKITARVLLFIIIAIAGLLTYVSYALPSAGKVKNITVESTAEITARGKYLANHVAVCIDCHSTRDWTIYSGPIVQGTEGKGGEYFGRDIGLPGDYYARNITPFNLKDWSDGELYHLITTGINKDGEAMFPIMPYQSYGKMTEKDVEAIIAYLRTLNPIENTVPERSIDFPMNFIINTIPTEAIPSSTLTPADGIAYGEYITTIAACADCHTPQEKGAKIEGMDFAGGFEFKTKGGTLRSVNITPDETGIASWSKDVFINRFKSYSDTANLPKGLQPDEFNTVMPWVMYSGMTEEDLGAIYDYLKTIKPVKNQVERFTKN